MNSEQYNLYIEADEEVTTIISRLHVAHRKNVALVVPQHSLLLQSIINLRLLAREAKKQQKNIVIVTQDTEGATFAKKIGITTIPLSQWQEDSRAHSDAENVALQDPQMAQDNQGTIIDQANEEYIEDEAHYTLTEDHVEDETGEMVTRSYQEKIHRTKRPVGMDIAPQSRKPIQSAASLQNLQSETPTEVVMPRQDTSYPSAQTQENDLTTPDALHHSNISNQDDAISTKNQQLHYRPKPNKKSQKSYTKIKDKPDLKRSAEISDQENPRKVHTLGWLLAFLSAAFVVGFLILPYNVVDVKLGENQFEDTLSLTAKTSFEAADTERRMIPLRTIEKEITRTIKGPATGKEDVEAGKAYGTLKIYNTFSESPQPLVATTRFESPEGVIFRLVKGTTVPGMKKVNDKVEPGFVEVSVEADKPGSLGDIGSVKWTIPGFENNKEKFANFYAQNEQPMTDGNPAGKDATVVTQQDIKKLEEESTDGLSEYLATELSPLLRETEVLLPEALTFEVTRSESTVTPGTAAPQAQYVINARVKAFVFDSKNIDQIIDEVILTKRNIDPSTVELESNYNSIKLDTNDQKLSFANVVSITSKSDFDQEKFKNDIKGKKQEQVKDILKNDYPFVSEIALRSYPPFLASKFSRYAWMTKLNIKKVDDAQ